MLDVINYVTFLNRELVSRASYVWLVFCHVSSKSVLRWEIFLRFP